MRAAVLHGVGEPLIVEDVAIAQPGAREVVIRTAAAGVCHSDLHFIKGDYPHPLPAVIGHESAGVVERVGAEVRSVRPGDHVITCLSSFCGRCEHCLTGHMSRCVSPETRRRQGEPSRLTLGGQPIHQFLNLSSFAEEMLIHENACVRVPDEMPLDRAALIGCSVVTGVGAVIHTARVRPGESVAVVGCGGVGLACVNGAAIAGAGRIIAVDPQPSKRDLATRLGATDLVDPEAEDPVERIREITGGGVHHSFEAIGLKHTTEQAFRMLGRGGTCTLIGMIPVGTNIELAGSDFLAEKRIQGSLMGSNRFPVDMPRLVDFYLSGKLKLDDMISRHVALDEVNEALAELETGHLARSVVEFDG